MIMKEVPTQDQYIFRRSDGIWNGLRLIDPNGADDDEFGWSVSIDGHFAVAGAHYNDGGEDLTNSGSARIFEEIEDTGIWGTLSYHRLIPSDTAASDEFGFSVSFSDLRQSPDYYPYVRPWV